MTRTLTAVLLAYVLAGELPGASRVLVIQVEGTAPPDVQRGIEFGLAEVQQTARLLGVDVRLAGETERADPVHGVVVAAKGETDPRTVPAIHIGPLPSSSGACDFSVAVPREHGTMGTVVRWHPSLNRFGASELNERFSRQYSAPMRDLAWAGWIAMKALVESALRTPEGEDPCAGLARLRFDGHKGRPLRFDPRTRVLLQPLYTVRDGRVVGESK